MQPRFPLRLASEWPGSVCSVQVANKYLIATKQHESAVKTAATSLQPGVTKYLHSSTFLFSARHYSFMTLDALLNLTWSNLFQLNILKDLESIYYYSEKWMIDK